MTVRPSTPKDRLLIFDCDGVLVDSETISVDVLVDVLRQEGLPVDASFVYRHFLGRSMDAMRSVLRAEFDYTVRQDVIDVMRDRMTSRLTSELLPVPRIAAALKRLNMQKCVASSSRPERIRLSLRVTSLLDYFEPDIFSASMVSVGKPAPDLFLFAAQQMGFVPEHCTVIEDSPAGVEAAKRAGMQVFGFTGGGHAAQCDLKSALAALDPDAIFDNMLQLPKLLAEKVH